MSSSPTPLSSKEVERGSGMPANRRSSELHRDGSWQGGGDSRRASNGLLFHDTRRPAFGRTRYAVTHALAAVERARRA